MTLGEPGMWVAPGLDPDITAGWVTDCLEDGLYLDRTCVFEPIHGTATLRSLFL